MKDQQYKTRAMIEDDLREHHKMLFKAHGCISIIIITSVIALAVAVML